MIRFAIIALAFGASPAAALTLAECKRTTHISHGGEARHVDHGAGRVGYIEWWSQEGVYTDVVIMNCDSGEFLRTRTREERVSDRWFDRRAEVAEVIDTAMQTAPALFSFTDLERALKGVGRDTKIAMVTEETCACAAAYPELRGDKAPYEASE